MENIIATLVISALWGGIAGNQRTCGFFGGAALGLAPLIGHVCILAYPHVREVSVWHFLKTGKDLEQK